jgi:recombination protein RecA
MEKRRRRKAPEESIVEQFETSSKKTVEPRKIDSNLLIPSGLTLLNCACSDTPFGAYGLGKITTVPGGSSSGKTIFLLSSFAEVNLLPHLNEYDFIYDDVEEALEFDLSYLFGEETAERIKAPQYDGTEPVYSDTIQDLESNILKRCKDKECRPFIYVADSLDALSSEEELEREYKNALNRIVSEEHLEAVKQSYQTEKAKIIGRTLRMIKRELKKTMSALILIQQIRDKIGVTYGKKTTTSGGKAPFFYSTHQIWLSRISPLKSKGLKVGTKIKAEVLKNKLTGKEREIESVNIYYDYGIDDVESNIRFLCDEWWPNAKDPKGKIKKGTWHAEEFGWEGSRAALINKVEGENAEKEIQKIVGLAWNKREDSILSDRKRRF